MEEARQHSTLTAEQWSFAAVFFAGQAALALGIVSVLVGYGRGIVLGVAGLALSKTAVAIWTVARPQAQMVEHSPLSRILIAVGWLVFAALLIWAR